MNVFRAIENRRTIVVAGNTGDSGIMNPTGVVSQRIPIFTTKYFMSRVAPMKKITFYTRWGDVFAIFCIIIAVVLFLASLAKRYTLLSRLFPARILKTLT
jgi:apolipoprotein N-acyltransferase